MALAGTTRTVILPHFMRLHEWIALEQRYYGAEGLEPAVLNGSFRALKRADDVLRSSPDTSMPLWARNVPPELRGDDDYRTFGLGELLLFEPYSRQEFEEAIAFAEAWGLTGHLQSRRYEDLVSPVSG